MSALEVQWSSSELDASAENVLDVIFNVELVSQTGRYWKLLTGHRNDVRESESVFRDVLSNYSKAVHSFCKMCTRIIITEFLLWVSGQNFFFLKEQFPDLSYFELRALISAIMFYWFRHGYTKAFFFGFVFPACLFSPLVLLVFTAFLFFLVFCFVLFSFLFWCFVPVLIVSGISFPLWIPHGLDRDGPVTPSSFLLLLW